MPSTSIPTSRARRGGPGGLTPSSLGRGRATLLVLLLCAAAVGAGPVPPAQACSCVEADPARSFRDADAVFTGTLIERTVSHPDLPVISSADPARHVFAVDRVLKGEVHERQAVVSADSGASCGLELDGSGPFAVFAQRSGDGYRAGLCDGTGPLTPTLEVTLGRLAAASDDHAAAARLLPGGEPPPALWTPARTATGAALSALVLALLAVRARGRRR